MLGEQYLWDLSILHWLHLIEYEAKMEREGEREWAWEFSGISFFLLHGLAGSNRLHAHISSIFLDFPFFVHLICSFFSISTQVFYTQYRYTQPINIYWYRKYNRLPFMYLCTFDVCKHNRICVCVFHFVVVFFFARAPSFISSTFNSISAECGETHGKWRMTMFIGFLLTRLLVSHRFPFYFCFTHLIKCMCSSWLFSHSLIFCKSTSFRTQFHVSFIDISPFSFIHSHRIVARLVAQMVTHSTFSSSFHFWFLYASFRDHRQLGPRSISDNIKRVCWRMVEHRDGNK